jgi:hypothetical protein
LRYSGSGGHVIQQHAIGAERDGIPEDGADVVGIGHALEDDEPLSRRHERSPVRFVLTLANRKTPAMDVETGDVAEERRRHHVDGHARGGQHVRESEICGPGHEHGSCGETARPSADAERRGVLPRRRRPDRAAALHPARSDNPPDADRPDR